jgi:hypothetical protein
MYTNDLAVSSAVKGSVGLSVNDIDYSGPSESMRRDLLQVFARGQDKEYNGLSAGFLTGVKHQSLVRGNSPRHRGLYIGHVTAVLPNKGIKVELSNSIKRGDGIVFDQGKPEEKEEGGSIYEVIYQHKSLEKNQDISAGNVLLTFGTNSIEYENVKVGDKVWKNKDPALDQRLKNYLSDSENGFNVAVSVSITGGVGKPLAIKIVPTSIISTMKNMQATQASEKDSIYGYGESTTLLSPAVTKSLSRESIVKAIGTLGDTPFQYDEHNLLVDMDTGIDKPGLFLPLSEIKATRRVAVTDLVNKMRVHTKDTNMNLNIHLLDDMRINAAAVANIPAIQSVTNVTNFIGASITSTASIAPSLSVLCRTPLQVMAACQIEWLEEIVLDFLEVHGIREAVRLVQSSRKRAVVATPRIIKPDEERLVYFYLRLRVSW